MLLFSELQSRNSCPDHKVQQDSGLYQVLISVEPNGDQRCVLVSPGEGADKGTCVNLTMNGFSNSVAFKEWM